MIGRGRGGRGGRGGRVEDNVANLDDIDDDDDELLEDLNDEEMPNFDGDDEEDVIIDYDNEIDNPERMANRQQARQLIGRRLMGKTKNVYKSKIKVLKKWLWRNHNLRGITITITYHHHHSYPSN